MLYHTCCTVYVCVLAFACVCACVVESVLVQYINNHIYNRICADRQLERLIGMDMDTDMIQAGVHV